MEHKWEVKNLERELKSGRATTASFSCYSTHETFSTIESGEVNLPFLSSEAANWIPYNDLTEATAVKWVKELIDYTSIETKNSASIANSINENELETTGDGVPW
jgi:hypothetical protein